MIRIALPEHAEEHVAFAVSPLLECVLSLHVLVGPKHHALQHEWVRRMRGLAPSLRRAIDRDAFVFREQIPDAFVPHGDGAAESFDEELARFRSLPPDLLLSALGRPLHDHGGGTFDERSARARADDSGALLLDDPAAFAQRFAITLERYWRDAFAREWDAIEERLATSIVEAGRVLASDGVWAVLGRLPAHCRVDRASGELRVDLPHEHRVAVSAARPLVLSPSVFVWPHLRVSCDEPWPLALVFTAPAAAREAEPRIPQAELLRTLRALADDTRLRVLKLIAERPRTTQELEPLVGLSRAGLSKSLQRLAEVGLIAPRRDGYYVVYSLVAERVDAVGPAVSRYLDA